MQIQEIYKLVAEQLEGDAHALWQGLGLSGRNEYICRIQEAGNEAEFRGDDRDEAERAEVYAIAAEFEAEAAQLTEGGAA